jgi:hypothetical protein
MRWQAFDKTAFDTLWESATADSAVRKDSTMRPRI